jgi:hypothetical protein
VAKDGRQKTCGGVVHALRGFTAGAGVGAAAAVVTVLARIGLATASFAEVTSAPFSYTHSCDTLVKVCACAGNQNSLSAAADSTLSEP